MENILTQHIEITPGVVGGKPRIAGHRITVQNVVIWHERMGMSADEIDDSILADEAFVSELRKQTPSILREKLKEKLGE